ncbi:GumC family protein [Roseisalinus antarcticus]|uniref:Tyrosine-protein kinase ptk n=1 Tax=Roseisalinus antarcticus TaxID=254357 RepID=A0A1Y5THF3_9RHOB|nr:GNVR domain-containing protein [Roseisalinus antarcticus]SLN64346.1 Tyrosine-protein kinase ptk [Roseisalinus antarcticus]
MAEAEPALSDLLRGAFRFLRRRYLVICLGALVGLALAVFAVMNLEDRYRSKLLLMVDEIGASSLEAEAQEGGARDAFVDGQVYIIESNEILRDAVALANLTEEPFFQRQPRSWAAQKIAELKAMIRPPRVAPADPDLSGLTPEEAYAVRTLDSAMTVDREGDTNIISISVVTDGGRLSARVADAVGTAFAMNREAAQIGRATRVAGWLDDRMLELRRQLTEAEDAVAAFRIENNLLTGAQGTSLGEQQLNEFNAELFRTRAELAQRRAAYARAVEILNGGGDIQSLPEVQQSDIVNALRTALLDLQRREAELAGQGNNPRLAGIRDERAAIEAQLSTEVTRIVEVMANEVETLEAREQLVSEALREAGGQSGDASRSSVELRELERRAEAYRALYERYLGSSGLAEENLSFLASGVEIIDAASVPSLPFAPKSQVLVLFGLILGAMLGGLIGLLREAMLTGFMTVGQLQRAVGLPVMACVPRIGSPAKAFEMTMDDPMSAYSESIRTFRHELTELSGETGTQVITITSSGPGDGKTTMARAMAGSALVAGLDVLLIDADLRRAKLSQLLQMSDDSGLSELLSGDGYGFRERNLGGGLDVLPAGRGARSPSDLLAGKSLARYLEAARQTYDLIIIDAPPVANMADASILARVSDVVGFVVRWNETPREMVVEAMKRLDSEAPVGLALNAADLSRVAQYGESYEAYARAAANPRTVRRDAAA